MAACVRMLSIAALFAPIAVLSCGALSQLAAAEPPAAKAVKRPANRLAKETSPYLLLHAHNPVEWFPWGEEALAKAKAEKKLIFLSIGYSSCYWCHVMERESFMDQEIADYLNEHYVCIKVDREERPDVDEIYMAALQLLGRRGGWPLSMFLTPEAKPFFGGTYFPPRDKELPAPPGDEEAAGEKRMVTGFLTLIKLVEDRWQQAPDELNRVGGEVAAAVKRTLARRSLAGADPLDKNLGDVVLAELAAQYDEQFGGFGFSADQPQRPKFPEPPNLTFLIDRIRRFDDERARKMLVGTLERMAAGGIRDHVGGGFHRYSTDRYWRIPHFEKMLYDNAQLASVYAAAHNITGRDDFKRVAEEILAFVDRELSDPEGGFYSALDAETDAREGAYYVWTRTELEQALDADEFALLADVYGVSAGPNFEEYSVLLLPRSLADAAKKHHLTPAELSQRLEPICVKLLAEREKRKRPLTDTKVLAGWNGLMIRGLADAGRLHERRAYVDRAIRAAEFALEKLRTPDGRLLHTYGGGQAKLNAYLDDYAFLVNGLIALHQATGDARWLAAAQQLTEKQIELFWDQTEGGFYFTSSDHEELLARSKDPVDSVMPSGNAVAASNLVYLSRALSKPDYLIRARQTVTAFAGFLSQNPASMPRMAAVWTAISAADKKDE
ncbi:MAG TPA: thioredoxin domain-containing protein [Pirellulales bacterium]|nr:thioredoxin domain-containing protein [Pirellulales bacterium]